MNPIAAYNVKKTEVDGLFQVDAVATDPSGRNVKTDLGQTIMLHAQARSKEELLKILDMARGILV